MRQIGVLAAWSALVIPAHAGEDFQVSKVKLTKETYLGFSAIRMVEIDEAASTLRELKEHDEVRSMAWLPMDFHDGTIDVDVASQIASGAPDYARGFVGVAFRIDGHQRHESIYLRPANATVDDQVRRNHTVQYASFPGYDFEQLRREAPEKYETFADIALDRWIHMKIVVHGAEARLYLDGASNAALVVRDMKLGADQHGGVGITPGPGSIVHFRNLKATPAG